MARPQSLHQLGTAGSLKTINAIIYGPPGIGKTPFWGSGGERVVFMDSDLGTESAEATGSKAHSVAVTDYHELSEVYEWLRHDKHEFSWVVWDSLTLFQDRVLVDEITPDAAAMNPKQDPDVASPKEYLVNQNRIGRYVRLFAGLPINFGISCHVMVGQNPNDSDGGLLYMPAIQGKSKNGIDLATKVCGYMNVIGYFGLGKKEVNGKTTRVRRMLFKMTDTHLARDRFAALPTVMDDPTLPRVEELINAKREKMKVTTNANPTRPQLVRRSVKKAAPSK